MQRALPPSTRSTVGIGEATIRACFRRVSNCPERKDSRAWPDITSTFLAVAILHLEHVARKVAHLIPIDQDEISAAVPQAAQ